MKKILFISFLFLLTACSSNQELEHKLEKTQEALEFANEVIQNLEVANQNKVVHTLYFTLKEGVTDDERTIFLSLLDQLGELSYVNAIKVGPPSDIPDPRAKRDYDYAMQMQFASKEDLEAYAQDSTHLAIRAQAGPLLAGPPVVYDFDVLD